MPCLGGTRAVPSDAEPLPGHMGEQRCETGCLDLILEAHPDPDRHGLPLLGSLEDQLVERQVLLVGVHEDRESGHL